LRFGYQLDCHRRPQSTHLASDVNPVVRSSSRGCAPRPACSVCTSPWLRIGLGRSGAHRCTEYRGPGWTTRS
jgi:hypothetical protein